MSADGGLGSDASAVFRGNVIPCTDGTDADGDGYGLGCSAGPDCDDNDRWVNAGQTELCDGKDNNCNGSIDEEVLNACGTCDSTCELLGNDDAFPIDPVLNPKVREAEGVTLNDDGDLVLGISQVGTDFMWIANTNDLSVGTVSKINTVTMTETARYLSVVCDPVKSAAAECSSGCCDVHGGAVQLRGNNPSRTAVDLNFDAWVANRAFGGQASATKYANDEHRCIDRNGNGVIDTSRDVNGDGAIETDCNDDSDPDDASTMCLDDQGAPTGSPPEFLGLDDECILFTVNYGEDGDTGRSICLDGGNDGGPSNAWVGTNARSPDRFYRINGINGSLDGPYDLPSGHHPYGCAVDGRRILWSVSISGNLAYLNTQNPTEISESSFQPPSSFGSRDFYGVTIDDEQNIWFGGWKSAKVFRYAPDRSSFENLGSGVWTGIKMPTGIGNTTRGIASDDRNMIWVAVSSGYVWRLDRALFPHTGTDTLYDLPTGGYVEDTDYWRGAGSSLIGVGVDMAGNVWGVSYSAHKAARLDVDEQGNIVGTAPPMTDSERQVDVGRNPYSYSDFTGNTLRTATRNVGTYRYLIQCPEGSDGLWEHIAWNATLPAGTAIEARARSGGNSTSLGQWSPVATVSPADLSTAGALTPNPAPTLEIEFTLKSDIDQQYSPILHDFNVSGGCAVNIR